jgi:S-adenosylmethionine decarboxylase
LSTSERAPGKALVTLDARVADTALLVDARRLTARAVVAVEAAGGHVLDRAMAVFPNGAVTLVLVLAESHLSIHTWPEERLLALDLFSCGAIDGERVMATLTAGLELGPVAVRRLERGVGPNHGR